MALIPNLTNASLTDLLATHSAVLDELRRRKIIRSKNNPTGDYTEWLVSERLGLTLEPNATKGHDATDQDGLRYQIKGRRLTAENTSSQLGVIRNLEENPFDFLIGLILDENWRVLRAAKIPRHALVELATFRPHVNGHTLHLRPSILQHPLVEDISSVFHASSSR